jgi:alpha-D-ribose 1-methylphosphonate 5-triphosphate synthase subunit PhnG
MMTPEQRHRILALTPLERLHEGWLKLGIQATHRCVRGPETGMVMVRGRIGGTGNAFNLGEMTLTRVSVVLDENTPDGGDVGHGWVAGRSREHAELIALIDACAHKAHWARRIDAELIEPLTQALADDRAERSQLAAATRVDFFTMVRGE